jgi:hypothetical protein
MNNKLKIGLIVDSERASKYVYELAEWANSTDALCVSHLIGRLTRVRWHGLDRGSDHRFGP